MAAEDRAIQLTAPPAKAGIMGDGKRRLQPIMWASVLSILAAIIAGERHGLSLS